ncbi:cation-transporting P-type ATPase [Marinobacter zhejiangensis]|uniref:ATPase, P-type (Transporting), HAD superfamily, subfamily IC n=1 Tax=Marinobacter zhejiangensis TaxID=488535 RepID=A0A1I4NFY9_9GAMM|nr:cation-transporting P-type ATPase [Marinobacter zhejiangensis]SFM14306.1 ATPase, P-type (transporting), HAD superfamily, subfamily IC [Marinobacter zhejiangensis]
MEQRDQWHRVTVDAALAALETSPQGLSQPEIEARHQRYGANRLPAPPPERAFLRFLRQFHHILIYVLIGAATITGLLGHWLDTSVILAVVLLNALIGYVQEGRAARAITAIRHMLAPQASVLRSGRRLSVAGEDLVPGDVVLLDAGDRVPADLRLIRAHSLQIQEAILTGESVAVDKQTEPLGKAAAIADRSCMAYSGTTVTRGQGCGVVVATGGLTEVGQISGMLVNVDTLKTPLIEQMEVFARWLTLVIAIVAGLLLVYGHFVQQQAFAGLFMAVVGLSVAAIPEGLPAVLTITLAVGVQAMAKRHAIVRRLPAIETIGSVSVICTDKTGTLTRNEMSVATLVAGGQHFDVECSGYAPTGSLTLARDVVAPESLPLAVELLVRTAVLCNDAELHKQEASWHVEGDPMEGALLALAGKVELYPEELRSRWRRTDVIPFDTRHRFMATLNHDHRGHGSIFLKGAPEAVLALCVGQLDVNGDVQPLEERQWHRLAEQIAAAGQRVLAFAYRPVSASHSVVELADLEQDLVMIGLAGFIDPPREEALAAVVECQRAGIAVKMITGDHASTAAAIGHQLGLPNSHHTLTGTELDRLSEDQLAAVVRDINIFARTSPEHKLRLVKALQSQGMTVAMTGDGVNDAPALRRADIGIAMGGKGTEAAKEVSDLVLADDNFASIVAAVREGRTVWDNIRKMIGWTLPTSSGEAFAIVVALLAGLALPVTPIQILWVNMITTVSLGLALAFEPTEEGAMRRCPRPRHDSLLSGALLWQIALVTALIVCGVFGIYSYAVGQGYTVELARTLAMNTLVVMEIFYLFFIRNMNSTTSSWNLVRGTPVVWLAVVGVTLGQVVITYLPPAQTVFGTRAVSLVDAVLVIAIGFALYVAVELEKQLRLRLIRAGQP